MEKKLLLKWKGIKTSPRAYPLEETRQEFLDFGNARNAGTKTERVFF